jgi:hypothetical protein
LIEFKLNGNIHEVFAAALEDFKPGDELDKVKQFLSIVFDVTITGDTLADLGFQGYEKPNKKFKKADGDQ